MQQKLRKVSYPVQYPWVMVDLREGFVSQKESIVKRIKELGNLVDKPDVKAGMLRRKMDDHKIENVRFLEKAVAYIESLKDRMLKEELYDGTPKFACRIKQAIDRAED